MNGDAFEIPIFFTSAFVAAFAALVSAVGGDSAAALGWCSLGIVWTRFFMQSVEFDPPSEENPPSGDVLDASATPR